MEMEWCALRQKKPVDTTPCFCFGQAVSLECKMNAFEKGDIIRPRRIAGGGRLPIAGFRYRMTRDAIYPGAVDSGGETVLVFNKLQVLFSFGVACAMSMNMAAENNYHPR